MSNDSNWSNYAKFIRKAELMGGLKMCEKIIVTESVNNVDKKKAIEKFNEYLNLIIKIDNFDLIDNKLNISFDIDLDDKIEELKKIFG